MSCLKRFALLLLAAILSAPAFAAPAVRLKDIAYLQGLRGNQLLGIGLVTGLSGKGDSSNSSLLKNALASLVANFGFRVEPGEIRSKNCAVVMVSSEIPPFLRAGDEIDVRVSSIGDARGLDGGVLLQTPLKGANGKVYALAQGQISVPGSPSSPKTVGTIPAGGIVEEPILSTFISGSSLSLILRNPDFVTASGVAEAIRGAFSNIAVRTVDASLVEVQIPADRVQDPVRFIAELESLTVTPEASGKVVIDSASGVIIYGEKVRIGRVAVSYKMVSVNVGAVPRLTAPEDKAHLLFPETTTVEELVKTLQTIGLETETLMGILKAIDRAGSLYGTLIIM